VILETAIIAKLLQTPAVVALCGSRIYPGSVPKGEPMPAIVVNKISGAPLYTDDGQAGLESDRVQVDAWGETYTDAKPLADAFKSTSCLSGFAGQVAGIEIKFSMIDAERDDREGGSNATAYRFRTSVDFIVWYQT